MASHVALLRGINVGGRNKVPMAELREVVASLGHTGVTTYIQSGNVLFTTTESDTGKLASDLEAAITGAFGLWASVVVVTRDELARILDRNPYPDEPKPQFVHVVFLNAEPPADLVDQIRAAESAAAAKGGRDAITAIGPALYMHTPDGFGTSDLAQMVFRIIGPPGKTAAAGIAGVVPAGKTAAGGTGGVIPPGQPGIAATARNWATATKLLSLCGDT